MRANDPAQLFGTALCGADCKAKWSKWCPHCNLVFCANHIIPSEHKCGQHQQESIFPELIPKPKKPRAPRKKKTAAKKPEEKPTQQTLHQGPPTANGTAAEKSEPKETPGR